MGKKVFIPIGALIIAICAITFFTLRSDTPKEPIIIYKTTTPAAKSTAEASVGETSQGGHFHEDGTFHAIETSAQVESRQSEDSGMSQDTRNASATIAFGGETESQTPEPPSEAELAEQRYNIAFVEYYKAMQEYRRKELALDEERKQLDAEDAELIAAAKDAIRTGNREKGFKVRDGLLDLIQRQNELSERSDALKMPIPPTPPPSMERSSNR